METLTILAIDPSPNFTGVAIYTYDIDTEQVTSIIGETVSYNKLRYNVPVYIENHPETYIKRYMMVKAFRDYLDYYNPAVVVSESPFFNPSRPASFASLSELLIGFYDELVDYNPVIPFYKFAPQSVKKAMNCAGVLGKDIVLEQMKKNELIMDALKTPIDQLTEHSVDAICVGFAWLQEHIL
jgi:Holliday junction resolvasome RuvABC endonuclease subunit